MCRCNKFKLALRHLNLPLQNKEITNYKLSLPTMAWYYMCRHVVYLQYKLLQPSTHYKLYYMCRHVVYLQYKLLQPSTHYELYYMCRHVVYLQYKLLQPSTHYELAQTLPGKLAFSIILPEGLAVER
ncbi:hypothetical protein LAZ67_11003813 [Cordylochernes scorpioides]|uniref:Uncharacterized protein n=1 Tax=Cordylochernes scorpioides TaxID=51811 RepID=A0ABY6L074_9ARAC|nr:hypothetical protein LAZ67_11003813 [Cordylochernes scorpioides]